MIKNRFSSLIAERGLKITKVALDTGISRPSLTAIAQNDTEMIRLETVNTLCKYLGITPTEFFEYIPLDVEFSILIDDIDYEISEQFFTIKSINADILMTLDHLQLEKKMHFNCSLYKKLILPLNDFIENEPMLELLISFDDNSQFEEYVATVFAYNSPVLKKHIYTLLTNTLYSEIRTWLRYDLEKQNVSSDLISKFLKAAKHSLKIKSTGSVVFTPY